MSARGPRTTGLVEPALGRPSGGSAYDAAVARAWPSSAGGLERLPVPVGVASTAAQLEAALRTHPVSVVDGLLGCEHPEVLAAVRAAGHRVVLLVHLPRPEDVGLAGAERERLARLEREAVHAADAVVVPSHWAARDLQTRYGRRDLVVARPGATTGPVAPEHDPPVLLQLGAVGPLKNQLLTVRALASGPPLDVRLRVVGPVVDEAYARELTAASALLPEGTVSVEPATVGAARDAVLAGADLLLSVAHRETWGLTVTEALARGVPAVVGRGTGAEEALAAGGSPPDALPGAAVSTGDPDELGALLRAYATDPGLRRRWRGAARTARAGLPGWAATARTVAAACLEDELGAGVLAEGEAP